MKHILISLGFFLAAVFCTTEATNLFIMYRAGIVYTNYGAETSSWVNLSFLAIALSALSALILVTNQKQIEKWLQK